MKKLTILLLILLLPLVAKAHDIEVANEQGKTIYYLYTNNNTDLAVSYRGSFYSSYSNEYTGNVVIPGSVTYEGKTYSVTSISQYAFRDCSSLTSITIPNSVTYVYSFTTPSSAENIEGNDVALPTTYTVSVYAKKEGYLNSEIATKDIDVSSGGGGSGCDVDGDGSVTITDAVKVVNKILEQE